MQIIKKNTEKGLEMRCLFLGILNRGVVIRNNLNIYPLSVNEAIGILFINEA